jgi:transposase
MENRYIREARISERKFKELLMMFCVDVPALTASALTRVNRKTSQRIYGLLRRRVVELALEEARPFTGEVEIDESYFGPRRVRGRRGRGAGGKTPVIGLLKRGGKVFTSVVANCSRAELEPVIKGQVPLPSDRLHRWLARVRRPSLERL